MQQDTIEIYKSGELERDTSCSILEQLAAELKQALALIQRMAGMHSHAGAWERE